MTLKASFKNRAGFYASARQRASGIFGTSISQSQVQGVEAILDEAERRGTPLRHLAYILATAYHESARTMQAVRETLASTDNGAIAALDKAWKAGKLGQVSTAYWRKDGDGKSWFGRGLVQITHKANYQKLGLLIGVDLVRDPAKALELSTAVKILFVGMELGSFTGKSLADYDVTLLTHPPKQGFDYVAARRIVNGTDKAALIAGYAKAFEKALRDAGYTVTAAPLATPIPEPKPSEPEKPAVIAQGPVPSGGWIISLLALLVKLFTRWKK